MTLSSTAQKIFNLKYARNNETWEQACLRVALHVASAYKDDPKYDSLLNAFYNLMVERVFIPGGRILANSGTDISNLMNCFVLGIEDSRESIYGSLKNAAEIFAHGGGVGYNFSNIRERGAKVRTTGGAASGPLSFLTLFDQTGEVISQASRRGAQIAFLDIDHPDIENFINYKNILDSRNARLLSEYKRNLERQGLDTDGKEYFNILEKTLKDDQLTHFNISVMLNDKFMKAVLDDESWPLISRVSKEVVKTVNSNDLIYQIAQEAWESGDPGIAFFDRINEDNMVPYLGNLNAGNPCAELFIFPNESCCLGSLNLHKFYIPENNSINWEFLEYAVRVATRFLDSVQTVSFAPIEEINYMSKGLRRLGLGVMGWADLLAEMEIPYSSDQALELADKISWFIAYFSTLESMAMADELGRFPLYDEDKVNLEYKLKILNNKKYSPRFFDEKEIRKIGFRNVATVSIAPTGSIALIADVNSSIEPFFALYYKRFITEGIGNTAKDHIVELNPILIRKLERDGFNDKQINQLKKHLQEFGTLEDCPEIFGQYKAPFITSSEISPETHILMQAAWQTNVDNSISKTINLPNSTTVENIVNVIIMAWNNNLKGCTIYRDGSKLFQILNKGS